MAARFVFLPCGSKISHVPCSGFVPSSGALVEQPAEERTKIIRAGSNALPRMIEGPSRLESRSGKLAGDAVVDLEVGCQRQPIGKHSNRAVGHGHQAAFG